MGEWLDVIAVAAFSLCLIAPGFARLPSSAVRIRRLRSGTWALVRLRRFR